MCVGVCVGVCVQTCVGVGGCGLVLMQELYMYESTKVYGDTLYMYDPNVNMYALCVCLSYAVYLYVCIKFVSGHSSC